MPIVIIYGMPNTEAVAKELPMLSLVLRQDIAMIPELELNENQVSVFYPHDLCAEGLFKKPERTTQVKKQIAENLHRRLTLFAKHSLPQCTLIEVLVKEFDPDSNGFAPEPAPPSPHEAFGLG